MASGAAQENGESLAGTDLVRVTVALAAGFMFPGLGHVVVKRARRGLTFAALILACFGLGLVHDGRLALRDGQQPFLSTLQVVANVGVGAPDVVARWLVYGRPVYSLQGEPSLGAFDERNDILRARARSAVSLYGTAYLWTAGLMNLLLLFEVWDIGVGRRD